MKRPTLFAVSGLLIALALGGCAAPSGVSDARLLQRVDSVMREAAPSMSVGLRLTADTVKTGETVGAEVISGMAGFVYLFQLGTDGRSMSLVFPNAMDGANYIAQGASMVLPRPNWRLSARGPAGVGQILAVVSEQPLDLMAVQGQLAQGQLAVPTPYGAAMASLRELAP